MVVPRIPRQNGLIEVEKRLFHVFHMPIESESWDKKRNLTGVYPKILLIKRKISSQSSIRSARWPR